MITNSLSVKAGDSGFDITFALTNSDGSKFDLTGLSSVRFKVVDNDIFRNFVNAVAMVDGPPTDGKVKYTVQAGDFDREGNFLGGLTLIFPAKTISSQDIFIKVDKSLGSNTP